jgi:hypothetical protein
MGIIVATGLSIAAIIAARRHKNEDPNTGRVVAGFGIFLLLVAIGNAGNQVWHIC